MEVEPVGDHEFLYRRIPATANPPWYDVKTGIVLGAAFIPHKKSDTTGLSLQRANLISVEKAAKGRRPGTTFLAVIRAAAIRVLGLSVVPSPVEFPDGTMNLAHAEIPELNSAVYRDDRTLEFAELLASACEKVIQVEVSEAEFDGQL